MQSTSMEINLGGNMYLMLSNYQALREIEHEIGKSLVTLVKEVDKKGILISEQIKIIYHSVKASGNILSEEEIGKIICQQGIIDNMKLVLRFLHQVLGKENYNGK
jgi:hypothetical protein